MIAEVSANNGSVVGRAALAAAGAAGVATVEATTDAEGMNSADATIKIWSDPSRQSKLRAGGFVFRPGEADGKPLATVKASMSAPSSVAAWLGGTPGVRRVHVWGDERPEQAPLVERFMAEVFRRLARDVTAN
jgi:hypothetical protein